MTKQKTNEFFLKAIKKVAYNTAKKEANMICTCFLGQEKQPDSVKKLRKF